MLFVDKLSKAMLYERAEIFLLFLYLVIYPSIDYMQYKYRFEYKYKENIAISVTLTILTVLMSIVLILCMPEDRAFANTHIKKLTLPESLVTIGDSAFKDNELIELYIPKNVVKIGEGAFNSYFCTIRKINVNTENKFLIT